MENMARLKVEALAILLGECDNLNEDAAAKDKVITDLH